MPQYRTQFNIRPLIACFSPHCQLHFASLLPNASYGRNPAHQAGIVMALRYEGTHSSFGISQSPKEAKEKLKLRLTPSLYRLSDRVSTKPSILPALSSSSIHDDPFTSPTSDPGHLYPDWLESRKDFKELRNRYERLSSLDVYQICKKQGVLRCDFERMAVVKFLEDCPFFASMKGTQLTELSDRMTSLSFSAGETLMHEGDPADCLYLLLQGTLGIYNDHNLLMDEVTHGNVIGESAIQNKTRRTATVKAHDQAQALKLTYEDFDAMAFQWKLRDFYDVANFLSKIDYFSDWTLSKLYRMASVSIIKQYQKGQVVFTKGEYARDLYIVKQGEIHMDIELDLELANQWPTASHQWACIHTTRRYRKTVRSCLAGDMFGERELIDGAPLSATATCASTAILCIVKQQFFVEIFSEKDRKRLYRLTERPITRDLRYELAFEHKKAKAMSSALLNALNTNPLPAGRSLFEVRGSERKLEWARKLVQRQKLKERKGVVKQTRVLETIRTEAHSP